MSSTLETTHNLLLIKINSLIDIISIIDNYKIPPIKDRVEKYHNELQDILLNYETGSIKILADYFLTMHDFQTEINRLQSIENKEDVEGFFENIKAEIKKNKADCNKQSDIYFAKYQLFIKKENFVDKINRYYKNIKNIADAIYNPDNSGPTAVNRDKKIESKATSKPQAVPGKTKFINLSSSPVNRCVSCTISADDTLKVKKIFSKYENSTIARSASGNVYNKCDVCLTEMKIIANLSEIVCTECGITERLYGTVLEDEQLYYQEGQRSKHGSYDPSKHCRFWIERIQARESKEIPDSVLQAVRKCIRHNKIRNTEDITYKEIRNYLSQTRNTSYNEHVPLIRKIITGESPAQLTDQELQLIQIHFDKVIRIYDEIKPSNKTNVPYHPYLIYKIIEHILHSKPRDEFYKCKKRMFSIMSCIHLQSRETLIENDKTWRHICDYIPDITYRPTDRNEQYDNVN